MEDNKTIAEMNAEADEKLLKWSLEMVLEDGCFLSRCRVEDLWCWLDKGFYYECPDGRGVYGCDHAIKLVKNNGIDDESGEYSHAVAQAMGLYSTRLLERERYELVLYGLMLYVLRITHYAWDVKDFEKVNSLQRTGFGLLWTRLCPMMVAFLRGLMQGKDVLTELESYPVEFIDERLKASLPDNIREAFEPAI